MTLFKCPAGLQGQAIAQPMDLFQGDFLQFTRCVGPMEGIPVQPFHEDPKTCPVPLEDLDQCAPAVAEREHTVKCYNKVVTGVANEI